MAVYKVYFKESLWKDFKAIPNKDLTKILKSIESLGINPRQINCRKLSGQEKYRLRVGRYCIIYSVNDEELTIWVVKIGHRKDIYR